MKKLISTILVLTMLLSALALTGCVFTPEEPEDPDHEHTFGEWTIIKNPTCVEKGSRERVCECGKKEEEELDVAQHLYAANVTDPTTEADGHVQYVCTFCNDSYDGGKIDKLPSLRDGLMIYHQDFNSLTAGLSTVEILKALGWKNLFKNGRELPEHSDHYTSAIGANAISKISLAVDNGQLVISNPQGAGDSFLRILTDEYMAAAAKGDYTIQIEMTFKSGGGWASIAPRYKGGASASYYAGWKVRATGMGNHDAIGTGGQISPALSVNTVKAGSSTVANGWWCSRVKGFQDITTSNKSGALIDRKITVIMQVVNAESDYNYKPTAAELGDTSKMTDAKAIEGYKNTTLGYGFHVWVLDENGQRVLVSAYNPESIYNTSKENWSTWLGDAVSFGVSGPVTVAIDNLAIWTGLGEMPEDKSTAAYERLLQPIFAPIFEDVSEEGIVVAKDNEAKLYIVLPENPERTLLYARDRMVFNVRDKANVHLYSGSLTTNAYELLLGDTGREESKALKATLTGHKYAIKTIGNKIVIVATNDAFLYEAVQYLNKNYLKFEDGKMVITEEIDYVGEGDTTTTRYLFTQSNIINSSTKKVCNIGRPDDDHTANQGGCTDGRYYYQAFIDRDNASEEANNTARIHKLDLNTGLTVKYSAPFSSGHTNDITYNPKTHKLYIANNKPFFTQVTVIDPDTLEFVENITIPTAIYSITYNPERDIYFIGCSGSDNVRGLTSDFKLLNNYVYHADPSTYGHTTQGIGSDDTFVYCVLWKSGANVIAVFDWYGNYVGTINIRLSTSVIEPESIDVDERGRILVVGSRQIFHIIPKA